MNKPIAKAALLIRRPVSEVFEAFVDPAITSKFWFTKGSGRLDSNTEVRWDWEMYHASIPVTVKVVETNKRILVEWSTHGAPTTVEWVFTPQPGDATFVSISNFGFSGDDDDMVRQALDATQGFTIVLAGLKALLEHNIRLNLTADRFPEGLTARR
jgi:uncharacterized protein YndB with AHSA1/START domain